jgi:hypothetical protein
MQSDPIGYEDGANWYNYVHSDPIDNSDFSGNRFLCDLNSLGYSKGSDCGNDPVVVTQDFDGDVVVTGIPLPKVQPFILPQPDFTGIDLGRSSIFLGINPSPFDLRSNQSQNKKDDGCAQRNTSGKCIYKINKYRKLALVDDLQIKACADYKKIMESNRKVSRYTGGASLANGGKNIVGRLAGARFFAPP